MVSLSNNLPGELQGEIATTWADFKISDKQNFDYRTAGCREPRHLICRGQMERNKIIANRRYVELIGTACTLLGLQAQANCPIIPSTIDYQLI